MFIDQRKPKDFDCGHNLDLMIEALPRIEPIEERRAYAKRIVGLIKLSHPNWVGPHGESKMAWDYLFELADVDLRGIGIVNPFETGERDDAR